MKNGIKSFNLNMPIELYNELKEESDKIGVNVTALIIFKIREYQKQCKIIDSLPTLVELANKDIDTNK